MPSGGSRLPLLYNDITRPLNKNNHLGIIKAYPNHINPTGQAMISAQAIATIEKNPTLKARIVNALKEGGTTALEEAIDHPAVKPVVALLKGFMDAK